MQGSKFSGTLGFYLNAKPNNCMYQTRDIFLDILSMSFPHSH